MDFKFHNKTISFTDSQIKMAELNKVIEGLAQRSYYVVEEAYENKILDWENLLDDKGALAKKVVDSFVPDLMKILVAGKIYDYDENDLKKVCYKNIDENYEQLIEPFMDVVHEINGDINYRASRKENRGRVVGGGFGFEGAVKGMAGAAAINAATGIAHGVFNFAGNALSALTGNRELSKLFKDGNVCWNYSNLCYKAIRWARFTIFDEYVAKNIIEKDATEIQWKKASVLFENIKKDLVPEEDRLDVILQILAMNPYEKEEYYDYLESLCEEQDLLELKRLKNCLYFRAQQTRMSDADKGEEPTDFDRDILRRLKDVFNIDASYLLEKTEQRSSDANNQEDVETSETGDTATENNDSIEDEGEKISYSSSMIYALKVCMLCFVLSLICMPLIRSGWNIVSAIMIAVMMLLMFFYARKCIAIISRMSGWIIDAEKYPEDIKNALLKKKVSDPKIIRLNFWEGVFTAKVFGMFILCISFLASAQVIVTFSVRENMDMGLSSGLAIVMMLGSIVVALLSLVALIVGLIQRLLYFKKEQNDKLELLIKEMMEQPAQESETLVEASPQG